MTTIAQLVAQAEQRVEAGEAAEVLEELWWVAQGAYDVGLGWLALKLLQEIERIVPAEAIDERWRGWLCNTRGLALSQGSSSAAARAEYERMRQLGKALDDADLESTALQNLGVQDVLDDDARSSLAASSSSASWVTGTEGCRCCSTSSTSSSAKGGLTSPTGCWRTCRR
jgi:hypothetical protein